MVHSLLTREAPKYDCYVNEIHRVFSVLNRVLQDKEFLVGGKFSYADAVFITGYAILFLFTDRFYRLVVPRISLLIEGIVYIWDN